MVKIIVASASFNCQTRYGVLASNIGFRPLLCSRAGSCRFLKSRAARCGALRLSSRPGLKSYPRRIGETHERRRHWSVLCSRVLSHYRRSARQLDTRLPPYRLEELAANYRLLAIYGSTDYVRSDCLMGYRQVFTDMAARPRRRHHRIAFRRRSSGARSRRRPRLPQPGPSPMAGQLLPALWRLRIRPDESSAYRNDWLIASSAFEPGQRSTSDISFSGVCDVPRRWCRFIGSSFM